MNVYNQQHHAHREALLLSRLAASPNLTAREAEAARQLASNAKARRAALDQHLAGIFFAPHHRPNIHRLLRQLRRDGDHSPQHVERMVMLAREVAHHIDIKRDPRTGGPDFRRIAKMEQLKAALAAQTKALKGPLSPPL